jgi:hypothetical protein
MDVEIDPGHERTMFSHDPKEKVAPDSEATG